MHEKTISPKQKRKSWIHRFFSKVYNLFVTPLISGAMLTLGGVIVRYFYEHLKNIQDHQMITSYVNNP